MGWRNRRTPVEGSALTRAQDLESGAAPSRGVTAAALVDRLLTVGIDGAGPFESAAAVAQRAEQRAGSREAAISAVTRTHVLLAGAGGFVTGLGGFATLLVAIPANVVEFYLVAARAVAAVAHLRGYELSQPQVRTAVLLTLAGADADDILASVGVRRTATAVTRVAALADQRLSAPVLMAVNKGVGFRLVTQAGKNLLERFGKAVPVIGGGIGAGFDAVLLGRIVAIARSEFPLLPGAVEPG